MPEERGRYHDERSDKKIKVNSSLSKSLHTKIRSRLALVCAAWFELTLFTVLVFLLIQSYIIGYKYHCYSGTDHVILTDVASKNEQQSLQLQVKW